MGTLNKAAFAARHEILRGVIERCDAQDVKGKKREQMALDYLCGATKALQATGNPLAENMLMVLTMIMFPRGCYSEAVRMVAEYEAELAKVVHNE